MLDLASKVFFFSPGAGWRACLHEKDASPILAIPPTHLALSTGPHSTFPLVKPDTSSLFYEGIGIEGKRDLLAALEHNNTITCLL
jgi:hypothetical protein